MIHRIKALLLGSGHKQVAQALGGEDERRMAVAALLVEAALMDDCFEAGERAKITELLKARYDLNDAETESLMETAGKRVADSAQLFGFTRVVNEGFAQEERVDLMEMLWQVVYADGRLDDYEANLMRRISGLIHVSDRDSGEARKRALARLGPKA
jgi:uncharacterized tellurite resistance protein B-like protein